MKIKIVSVGKHMPQWVAEGVEAYQKRFPRDIDLKLIEIYAGKRASASQLTAIHEKETQHMLNALDKTDYVVALDPKGKTWDTPQFAHAFSDCRQSAKPMCFLIGGPEGLHPDCLARANVVVSLSKLTYAHMLVRVILLEQLYRAWTLDTGHPYHR